MLWGTIAGIRQIRTINKNRYLPACVSILLLLLAVSCTKGRSTKIIRVGFSQCQGGDAWRNTMLEEMKRELSFHDHIEFIYRNADGNNDKQIRQLNELAAEQLDLLIVSPNELLPQTAAIERIFNNKIPVVLVDRRINSNKYTAFIGASNLEVGENAARYTAAILRGRGDIVEVKGLSDASPFIDRTHGFDSVIASYPGIHLVATVHDHSPTYQADLQKAISTKKVDLIFAQSDYIAKDVFVACKKAGLDKKIKIVGVDGLPGDSLGMDMVAKRQLVATVLYPTGGKEAMLTSLKILAGEPYLRENQLATIVIDSTNVRMLSQQIERVMAQQLDIDKGQRRIEEQLTITRNQTITILIISLTLALTLILGGVLFYYFQENKKIYRKLELQKEEISLQRNQLVVLVAKLKEATDAKFNFFTNISHELRTPLTLIIGPLDDALSSPKLHFTVKNNLNFIHRNTMRLLRLINQLMDFRKVEEGKMKLRASENDITAFVSEIASAFNDLARKKSISYNLVSNVHHLAVWFDATMLDKVLFNLLSNAFKFTADHGSIDISLTKTADGREVVINVADTGVGMNEEESSHAFELFYQGHSRSFKGTGLGLALSKELIMLHHGAISLQSEKGKGTNFQIRMPLGKEHLQPEEIFQEIPVGQVTYEEAKIYTADLEPLGLLPASENSTPKESTILIVEDNDDLRSFLKERLLLNYDIQEAENGEAGLAAAFDTVPDLIISDIVLPGKSGLQLTETLKLDLRTSHIPVILLTAKGTIQDQIEGIKMQADAFIVKPFHLEYLEETIKNLLKGRAMLREHYSSELPTETRSNSSNKLDRKFINGFTAIVESNIANEQFSVDDICREIGVSRVQLYRKVKALLGYNINDYILTVRLQKAKYLLVHEPLSIAEVAFKVGFASGAYFSTVFKSKFSVTPSEYREQKKR